MLIGQLDGRGHPGAGFSELVHLVDVDQMAHTLGVDSLKGKTYRLHPVHLSSSAADGRAAEASYSPRTAVVFVTP